MSAVMKEEQSLVTPTPDIVDTVISTRTQKRITISVTPGPDGSPVARSSEPYLRVAEGELCEITYAVDFDSAAFQTAVLQNRPLHFAEAAPVIPIAMQNGEYTVLWSNLDPSYWGQAYSYTVNLLVDGRYVIDDPTVQNDPPPPVIFP